MEGGAGDDRLKGDSQSGPGERMDGGPGADELNGADGDDEIAGGDGPDELRGDSGDDKLDGGPGTDSCDQGSGTGPSTLRELAPAAERGHVARRRDPYGRWTP